MKLSAAPRLFRLVILTVSVAYFVAGVFRSWFCRLLGGRVPGKCVVLAYHAFPAAYRARFTEQMDDVVRWTKPVAADCREPLADGTRYAAVTIDDAYQSVVENALPELAKRRIPSTIFAPSGNLGSHPRWEMLPDCSLLTETVVSAEQLRELPSDLVTIGSHTVTHPRLTDLDEEAVREELTESRIALESLLGRPVTLVAFPYGRHDQKTVDISREAGYRRVFTIIPSPAFLTPDEFVTHRVGINESDWRLEFRLKLFGAYCWMPRAQAFKRKLASVLRGSRRTRP